MARTVLIQLDLPKDWRTFQMPRGLQSRLQELLDRQDQTGKLTRRERQEANALAELAEMLSLMKLRVRHILKGCQRVAGGRSNAQTPGEK